jgi:ankyrin repeat protein
MEWFLITSELEIASKGRLGVAEILLAAGAHVNVGNTRGRSALFESSQLARTDVVKILLAASADLTTKTTPDGGVYEPK